MKILCAIGLRNGPELIRRAAAISAGQHEWFLLHVVDTGPRQGLEAYLRGLPGRGQDVERRAGIASGREDAAAQATLSEALRAAQDLNLNATGEIQRGQPEQVIVAAAAQAGAGLIVIMANEGAAGRPHAGPASVGHVARFVLDHAPCDVLLLRGVQA
jgi:nucleotide-binding universal stress UspA family protein